MADGSDRDDEGRDRLKALFGAGKPPILQHPGHAHPSRRRAAAAGMPIGRLVRTSDFGHINNLRANGIPGVMAPPRQPEQGLAPPVQQMRQMTGLAPNSRANTFLFTPSEFPDPASPTNTRQADVPFFQFNGAVDETDVLLIEFGFKLSAPLSNASNDNFMIRALLTWGVGNSQYSAIIDWKSGCVISLPANFLSVSARIPSTRIAQTPPFTLSSGVAYGTVPANASRATFTTSTATLTKAAASSDSIAIPDWAQSFGFGPRTYDAAFVGNLVGQPGGTGAIGAVCKAGPLGQQLNAGTFTIPNGCTSITFLNEDTGKDMAATVIFGMPF